MRRGEHGPQAFQAPVDVHAGADGKVYIFKRRPNESNVSSDDEVLNILEMSPQTYPEPEPHGLGSVQLLEREVLDGDSLNNLALQYGCKVADIKRVNNLMQEQDFFALKSIKIPVQKHSFLTETNADVFDPHEEMSNPAVTAARPRDRARVHPQVEEVTDFLVELDQDIEKLIRSTCDQDDDRLDTEKHQSSDFRGRRLSSHGSNWGIQWWNAVVAMLLIGIVLPLFYIVYFKTKDNGGFSPTDSITTQSAITSSNAPRSDHSTR